tara:strand:- start:1849 stop:2952 length:1104 start_codon:yes stop_codon:yes gene_type:complete
MINIERLLKEPPFDYTEIKKNKLFYLAINDAITIHQKTNKAFNIWMKKSLYAHNDYKSLYLLPFFPSAVFKYMSLSNKKNNDEIKTIHSSGTTSQKKSKIIIDSLTSKRQTQVLAKILNAIIGKRRPYLIIDKDPKIKSKSKNYSARIAGMSGYFIGAKDRYYSIIEKKDNLIFNLEDFIALLKSYINKKQPVVIIGYTYMVYKHIINNSSILEKIQLPKNSKLIHFGGWKKLNDKKISKIQFNALLMEKLTLKLENIIDIYGFTEQLGTVYPSFGDSGNLVPIYSDVIIRDPNTLKPVQDGNLGLVQFISPIPHSYPGISLLNDDIGRIIPTPENYRNIKQFEIIGRPDTAESRGCGDTLPNDYYI